MLQRRLPGGTLTLCLGDEDGNWQAFGQFELQK